MVEVKKKKPTGATLQNVAMCFRGAVKKCKLMYGTPKKRFSFADTLAT